MKKNNSQLAHRMKSNMYNNPKKFHKFILEGHKCITEKQIIGKVIKIYYDAGIWQKILTTPSIIAMIFITLILFDFGYFR